jgi:hypothetical protein
MNPHKIGYLTPCILVISLAWSVWTMAYVMWICGWFAGTAIADNKFPVEAFFTYACCFAVLCGAMIVALRGMKKLAVALSIGVVLVETIFWLSVMT